jgi:predicted RNase H-like HicB family nuclease
VRGTPADGYLGFVAELPGCLTDGTTPAEALANLDEAMLLWFETALSGGQNIPRARANAFPARGPRSVQRQMILRMPRTIHLWPDDPRAPSADTPQTRHTHARASSGVRAPLEKSRPRRWRAPGVVSAWSRGSERPGGERGDRMEQTPCAMTRSTEADQIDVEPEDAFGVHLGPRRCNL